jgi:large subunit ribosomal protein L4
MTSKDDSVQSSQEEKDTLTVTCYDVNGERSGEVALPAAVFGVTPHMPVMHQAFLRQMANRRQGSASTKTRAEVRGGGRKPYRQKGTGRARHGSLREPQMRGGGTVFGPQPRSFKQRMPRKMRHLALRSALSVKTGERQVVVIEGFGFDVPKTNRMAELLRRVGVEKKGLVVLPAASETVARSMANLDWAKTILAGNLNLRDIFTHDLLVIQKDAIGLIEESLTDGKGGEDD